MNERIVILNILNILTGRSKNYSMEYLIVIV